MEIVYDEPSLADYIQRATEITSDHPVLVDRFLDNAIEIDVDALCDGTDVYLAGVMEHIEEAGIHSGDSACALPPMTLGPEDIDKVRASTVALAHGIGVHGLMNVQFALKDDILYVIEANPRASRTVPFVSKATGVHLAKAAARIMTGTTIAQLKAEGLIPTDYDGGSLPLDAPIAVKEAVLPFNRFRRPDGTSLDTLLSPEMKSTGEVMGLADNFGAAYAKAEQAAFGALPTTGTVFVSVANRDKRTLISPSNASPPSDSPCLPPPAPQLCCAATVCNAKPSSNTPTSPNPVIPGIHCGFDPRRGGGPDFEHAGRVGGRTA